MARRISGEKDTGTLGVRLFGKGGDYAKLDSLLNVSQNLYNEILEGFLGRVKTLIKDPEYLELKKSFSKTSEVYNWNLIKKVAERYGIKPRNFEVFSKDTRNNPKKTKYKKLHTHLAQTISFKVFGAVKKYLAGNSKKLNFKEKGSFTELQAKEVKTGIVYAFDAKNFSGTIGLKDQLTKKLIEIPFRLKPNDDYSLEVFRKRKISYIRIVKEVVKSKVIWSAQFIYEGLPPERVVPNKDQETLNGLDLNVRSTAIVSSKGYAELYAFEEVIDPVLDNKIKKLYRRLERSRRANNPNLYKPEEMKKVGNKIRVKKGQILTRKEREFTAKNGELKVKRFKNSKSYDKARARLKELNRIRTERVKNAHRKKANELIVNLGVKYLAEDISGKGWAKIYGKSVSSTSQFFFYRELERKAKQYGGSFELFSTFDTALSQSHLNGQRVKKGLDVREHKDNSGFVQHRDLFSAFLACFVESKEVTKKNSKGKEYQSKEYFVDYSNSRIKDTYFSIESQLNKAWSDWEETKKKLNVKNCKNLKAIKKAIRRNIRQKRLYKDMETMRFE